MKTNFFPLRIADLKYRLKTRRGKCHLRILIVGFIGLSALAWYLGFIPIASGPARAGIRNALDVKMLPSSIHVNASGSETWTDYIFEADFDIDPEQFKILISKRDFKELEISQYSRNSTTRAYRIEDYSGFEAGSSWVWTDRPPDTQQYDHGARCILFLNKERDRVLLRFTSD